MTTPEQPAASEDRVPADDQRPIEDHAAIGNLRTVGLVGLDGSIDWCCFPRLDDGSVFAAVLDPRRGGRFRVRRRGCATGTQAYLRDTNVLETTFAHGGSRLVVTDCMPLRGVLDGVGGSVGEPAVHRLLRADGGDVEVEVEWSPRFRYGEGRPEIAATSDGFVARDGEHALSLAGLAPHEAWIEADDGASTVRARLVLRAGERRALVTRWGDEPPEAAAATTAAVVEEAAATWRSWVHKAQATGARIWAAPYQDLVVRAELALKLLVNGDTGAIAAAATTSLPEEIGGVRNWDYRYSWIRDAALAAQALQALGHAADAHAFVDWAERVARDDRSDEGTALRLVYGIGGETELDEREHPGLAGHRRSAPVRTGNGAAGQLQLDVFGELISAVYELVRRGEEVSADILELLPQVADDACRRWPEPDYGLWEMRNGPFHFVYSKVQVWVGLDRAIALAEWGAVQGDVDRWRTTCHAIRDQVLEEGFDPELGAFRQAYERDVLDASNLMFPILELLTFDDPRAQATIDATIAGLTDHGLVRRYRSDDGIAGEGGSFGLCNFWLIDALAMSGRIDEARQRLAHMASLANHVGLYAEGIDPATGGFLGNFPQAFTHVGLINSALYLAYAEGRDPPVPDPIGSDEHRARRPRPS